MDRTTKAIIGIGIVIVIVLIAMLVYSGRGPNGNVVNDSKEKITIGFLAPLSGDVATIGQNSKDAVEIAVDEVNDAGGIDGKKLEVIYEDGRCDGKTSSTAANKLVNFDNVPVIIGGLCSGETLSAAPVAEGKTVMLSPCSSVPSVTDAGDYIFRDYPSDSFQGKYAAEYFYNTLGLRNVAILSGTADWSAGVKEVFEREFKKIGGKIIIAETYEQSSRDLRGPLSKIKQANPDALYFLGYTEATVVGLKQARELGIEAKILGGDTWDDPAIAQQAGDAAEGTEYIVIYAPLTDEFKQSMKEKTGDDTVTICTPQAYDAVKIIAKIIKKVGTDPEKIKNELYNVKNYNGVSGKISFDSNGDLTDASYRVKRIVNGKSEFVN